MPRQGAAHVKATANDNWREMMRRLRLGNLRKLLRNRCGPTLPDDDAGREYLHELLLPISIGPHADIKMPNAIEVWAPWMQEQEKAELVDRISRTPIQERKPTGSQLGKRLRLTYSQRQRLKLWTIAPFNMSRQELLQHRRAKDRARKRRLRQLSGSRSRAEYEATSANQTKPWLAAGVSRASWYRRQRETSPSAVRLIKAADTPVSPENAQLPMGGRARTALLSKHRTPTTPEKPETSENQTAVAGNALLMNGRTCLNSRLRKRRTPDERLDPEGE
jgi:hypothetical protein